MRRKVKEEMKKKTMRKWVAGAMAGLMIFQSPYVALADSEKVVTLGADLTTDERNSMLQYFGVTESEVTVVEVNNAEERAYLEGIATAAQIGTHTYSCAYIMPTNSGQVNVKTANLTWVSTSMIANTLVTAGIDSCDVIAAAPRQVSGTGALTGIIKAYETVTDETLDADKTELAMEELFETAELGNEIGQEEASAVMNEVKTQVLKDGLTEQADVEAVVGEVAEYYDVELTEEKVSDVAELMTSIGNQDYDYDQIKGTMDDLQNKIVDNIDGVKESFANATEEQKAGILAAIGNFFSAIFKAIGDFFAGLFGSSDTGSILETTNEEALGIETTTEPGTDATENAESTQQPEATAETSTETGTGTDTQTSNTTTEGNTSSDTSSSSTETQIDIQTESSETFEVTEAPAATEDVTVQDSGTEGNSQADTGISDAIENAGTTDSLVVE